MVQGAGVSAYGRCQHVSHGYKVRPHQHGHPISFQKYRLRCLAIYQGGRQQQAAIGFNTVSDSLITATISSPGKNSLLNGWQFYSHQGRESYTLQWYIDFKLRWYPWEKFGSLFYEATYGKMIEQGLSNIKKHAQP